MFVIRNTVFLFIAISAYHFGLADDSRTDWKKSGWTPLFRGIDRATGEAEQPRLMRVQVLRIDIKTEGVKFFSTPRAEDDFKFEATETIRETVPQFLEKHKLQAALNANFYGPFDETTIKTPGTSNLLGLAVSQGQIVSPNQKGSPVFLVFKDNRAEIADVRQDTIDPPADVETAVAGNRILVDQGSVVSQTDQAVHPRTAVGISQDGRYVYFLVIDGRQPNHSIGATYQETGQWLVLFGSWKGLNLDGGGSTTMAIQSEEGKAKVLNVPVGQGLPHTYRYNGNSIGVYAPSLVL